MVKFGTDKTVVPREFGTDETVIWCFKLSTGHPLRGEWKGLEPLFAKARAAGLKVIAT